MSNKKKIYLASPLGFYESGRIFLYEHLIPLVESLNLEVIDPWRLTAESEIKKVSSISDYVERKKQWERLNLIIGENNKNGIENSDGLLAVLDGSDVDSGTASEIGFAYGIG
ncbi:MAG TPA: nucleoside 2-deoxyribosyltransferase, partial [Spirochaetota bacterium]|nr:nucleoside 2-deoxyribosyltransferase [Spirochaetota bacterium]